MRIKNIIKVVVMERNGSFGFFEALALCVGKKTNVPFVRLAKIGLKMCVGKK